MIQLLNGKYYDEQKLIDKMYNDDFYYGELNHLALSSSSIKLLLSSPKTYKFVLKYGNAESQALRDGWLFHTCILEPDLFEKQIFVDVQSKNSKAYRLAKEEHSKVFTIKEKNDAEKLADAFLRNETALRMINDSIFEQPMIKTIDGYPFRGKADVLGKTLICDLKTTTKIKNFSKSADIYSYDVQCYLYCNLFDRHYKDFKFVVIDKGSLDIGVWDCSEEFYLRGQEKVKKALEIFETYFIDGVDIDNYYLSGTL
jgi:hypothetical protein|tara:strand:+ start:11507 stop:12274 length:768 start_codon:yes stop_codon:yes gene_type:complete